LTNLRTEIRAAFERPARELRGQKWQYATGTSGTILALGAALRLGLTTEEARKNQAAQPVETEKQPRQLHELPGLKRCRFDQGRDHSMAKNSFELVGCGVGVSITIAILIVG
jgi:hypothetical protein